MQGKNRAGVGCRLVAERGVSRTHHALGVVDHAVDQFEVTAFQLSNPNHRNRVRNIPAAHCRNRLANLVAPFGNTGFVVDDLGKCRVGHVLHHHRVGGIDVALIRNQFGNGSSSVAGTVRGSPVKAGDGVVPQARFGMAQNLRAGGLFVNHLAVFTSEADQIGGFPVGFAGCQRSVLRFAVGQNLHRFFVAHAGFLRLTA